MFIEKTKADFEKFMNKYFPFYLQDWKTLTDDEKDFLYSLLSIYQNRDLEYTQQLQSASYIATGLFNFASCKDMDLIFSSSLRELKGRVNFATEKQIDILTDRINSDGRKLLLLMEKNPAAVSAFYIFYIYNFRVTEKGLIGLLSFFQKDKTAREKLKEDPCKGLKYEDYIRFIDNYFDEHPLHDISYQFKKESENKNILGISCLLKFTEIKRSDMKYVIPLLEYADRHFFEICTNSFMNDAEKTAEIIKEKEEYEFGSSWMYSLTQL